MLLVEILRNTDMYKEENYITHHLIFKNIPLLILSFISFQELSYFLVLLTFSTEIYIKNYINPCYTSIVLSIKNFINLYYSKNQRYLIAYWKFIIPSPIHSFWLRICFLTWSLEILMHCYGEYAYYSFFYTSDCYLMDINVLKALGISKLLAWKQNLQVYIHSNSSECHFVANAGIIIIHLC